MDKLYILNALISFVGITVALSTLLIRINLNFNYNLILVVFKNFIITVFQFSIIVYYYHGFNEQYQIIIYIIYVCVVTDFLLKASIPKLIFMAVFALINFLFPEVIKLTLLNILILLYEFYIYYRITVLEKNYISNYSIKQTFDNMNDGILCLGESMEINMLNNKMQEIINQSELFYKNYGEALIKQILNSIDDNGLYNIYDNSFYVVENKLNIKGSGLQYLFIDVSKSKYLMETIRKNNELLLKKQKKISSSIDTIEQTVLEEQISELRIKMHDVFGQRLSIVHTYLENMYFSFDKLNELKNILNNLRNDLISESNLSYKDKLEALIKSFNLIDVKINVYGSFPLDENIALLFTKIIRECSTNALRHASAKNINVYAYESNLYYTLKVENDGNIVKSMVEGNGIKGMRRSLLKYNGELWIDLQPRFSVSIKIKKDISSKS